MEDLKDHALSLVEYRGNGQMNSRLGLKIVCDSGQVVTIGIDGGFYKGLLGRIERSV